MGQALTITFIITLLPVIIALAISYYKHTKIYPLLYILSVYAYAHTVAYAIDTFALGRNGVLFLLVGSAALLIAIGKYAYE